MFHINPFKKNNGDEQESAQQGSESARDGAVSQEQVYDALRTIIDPDFGKDIVSLGFVKNLKIDGGNVDFTVELTTPACPVKDRFENEAKSVVSKLPGVKRVNVTMTAMERQERSGPQINTLEKVGSIIAISSCKGGVGKSTVAAHLARAIQRQGHRVGLLDVDIYGPSLPTLMQQPQVDVYARKDLIQPVEVDGLKTMSLGYIMGDKPAVMRGPMVSNYTMQILRQTDWGNLDYLIIDMPPGTGDIQLTLVQQTALDGAIIVTTPHALSLVDVGRGIRMFESTNVPVLGVVENMAYFVCDNCDKAHEIFGSSASALEQRFGLKTLARLPLLPNLTGAHLKDSGAEVTAFSELADNLHREIGMRRIEGQQLPEVTAEKRHVRIAWPDGTESKIPNKILRASCQCALCVNEYSGEAMLEPDTIPPDIQAKEVQRLGNYAVGITWSDGHSSGIFSWDRLREVAGVQEPSPAGA